MNCNDVRENLIELLTDGPADPQVKAHVSQCSACTEELGSMRKTMALLDEWESPEPSPYFLTRLRAHVKEERRRPRQACLAGCAVRCWLPRWPLCWPPVVVVYRLTVATPPPSIQARCTALADIESLDKNHDFHRYGPGERTNRRSVRRCSGAVNFSARGSEW